MKQPVRITAEQCGFDKLTPAEQQELHQWYKSEKDSMFDTETVQKLDVYAEQRSIIYKECSEKYGLHTTEAKAEFNLRCCKELPDEYWRLVALRDAIMDRLNEQLNRKVLALTWNRGIQKDALGKPLKTAEQWLDDFGQAGTLDRIMMERPYVKGVTADNGMNFSADLLIADHLKDIINAGFVSSESCSGMLGDHPDRRYYTASSDNGETYRAGQPVNRTLYGSNAYISFPKPESRWEAALKNTQGGIDTLRMIAQRNGWVAVDSSSMLEPALRLELPMTYDGSSMDEIIGEAERRAEIERRDYHALPYPEKVEVTLLFNKQVAQEHGGIVPWNDELIARRWDALAEGIRIAAKVAQEARISDIRQITRNDGQIALRCKIDGEQQMMRTVDAALLKGDKKPTALELCCQVYRQELTERRENSQEKRLSR